MKFQQHTGHWDVVFVPVLIFTVSFLVAPAPLPFLLQPALVSAKMVYASYVNNPGSRATNEYRFARVRQGMSQV